MTTAVASTATAAPATADSVSVADAAEFTAMMGQRLIMQTNTQQQAMQKSMAKVTEAVKQSMQDDEE